MSKRSHTLVPREPKMRQSISFSREQHDLLAKIAEENDVSFCWVVRYACGLLVKSHDGNKSLRDLKMEGYV